jgi:hypothetical protein
VISEIKPEVVFENQHVAELLEVCHDVFDGRAFVYISNRKQEYNVTPTIYLDLDKAEALKGIAIVSNKSSAQNMAKFESQFAKVNYGIFSNLEEARDWALEQVK